jgi:protocatechuate 3,4-dioxygenase beta subunit
MKVFFLSLLLSTASFLSAQPDNTTLLKEVETQLNAGTSVSQILTHQKYLSIHPDTKFRELIEKFSSDKTLAIAPADEPGKKIQVICTVKNEAGNVVPGALVYLYQTDAKGWYAADVPHVQMNEGDMRHARLFGYVKTNNKGQFELQTVKPSGYPKSDLPAHIHVHVNADGYRAYVTEFLFDDDDRLVGEIRANSQRNNFIISKPEKATTPFQQQFSYTITLTNN